MTVSVLPVEAHSSTLAGWYYCAYRCIQQLKGIHGEKTRALQYGSKFHDWMAQRPLGPDLERINVELQKYKVASRIRPGFFFHRQYRPDFDVYGDFDAFTLDRENHFRILEYKTIRNDALVNRHWYICPYLFQVSLYAWILQPLLEKQGLKLSDSHRIIWYSSSTGFRLEDPTRDDELTRTIVIYNQAEVEANLQRIYDAYHDDGKIIYPKIDWKCRNCQHIYRDICPKMRSMN